MLAPADVSRSAQAKGQSHARGSGFFVRVIFVDHGQHDGIHRRPNYRRMCHQSRRMSRAGFRRRSRSREPGRSYRPWSTCSGSAGPLGKIRLKIASPMIVARVASAGVSGLVFGVAEIVVGLRRLRGLRFITPESADHPAHGNTQQQQRERRHDGDKPSLQGLILCPVACVDLFEDEFANVARFDLLARPCFFSVKFAIQYLHQLIARLGGIEGEPLAGGGLKLKRRLMPQPLVCFRVPDHHSQADPQCRNNKPSSKKTASPPHRALLPTSNSRIWNSRKSEPEATPNPFHYSIFPLKAGSGQDARRNKIRRDETIFRLPRRHGETSGHYERPNGTTTGHTVMADRRGLKVIGFIFATFTIAVMLVTTVVVAKSYADGGVSTLASLDSR